MSAKQAVSLSRGHTSITIGTPALTGPLPMSWPTAPCGPGATMKSSAEVPFAANACAIAVLIRSTVSGAPSTVRASPFGVDRRSRSRAASIPASAARCARRIPASSAGVLTRRRSSKSSSSAVISMPSARRLSASHTGNPSGTTARVTPSALTARTGISRRRSAYVFPAAIRSSDPNSSYGWSRSSESSDMRAISIAPMTTWRTPPTSA